MQSFGIQFKEKEWAGDVIKMDDVSSSACVVGVCAPLKKL